MYLLRQGRIWQGASRWTVAHMHWVATQTFEREADMRVLTDYSHEVGRLIDRVKTHTQSIEELIPTLECYPLILALQAFRGIKTLVATWIAIEIGDFRRFPTPKHFMSFLGVTPSEVSTGDNRRLGAITKAGNIRLRSILMQSAWAYRYRPRVEGTLKRRNELTSQEVQDIAWRAQKRLHQKFRHMIARGKPKNKALVAVARELAGFIWDVARQEVLLSKTT